MSQGQKPTHVVVVYDGADGDSSYSCRVGVAWPTKDGDGFTLKLHDGISISGASGARICILKDRPKEDRDNDRDRDNRNDRGRGDNRDNDRGRGDNRNDSGGYRR